MSFKIAQTIIEDLTGRKNADERWSVETERGFEKFIPLEEKFLSVDDSSRFYLSEQGRNRALRA